MRLFCEQIASQRQHMNWEIWMESNFPLQLEPSTTLFSKPFSSKTIMINVKFENSEVRRAFRYSGTVLLMIPVFY